MADDLTADDIKKLNEKMDKAYKKIDEILKKNFTLKGDLDAEKLAKSSTINNSGSLSDKTKDRIDNFNEFNTKILTTINKLGVQEKQYIQAVASSIENMRTRIYSEKESKPEKGMDKAQKDEFKKSLSGTKIQIKNTKNEKQKLNKIIRNFEIKNDPVKYAKQEAKEMGKSLKESKVGKVASAGAKKVQKFLGRAK